MLISRQTQNKINLSRILHLIWQEQGISRSEIARRLNLDKSTLTNATYKLLEAGIIEEWKQGEAIQKAGRRPTLLRINSDFGVVLGIEFRPESYHAVLCDPMGNIIESFNGTHPILNSDFIPQLSSLITELRQKIEKSQARVLAIGIGLSGIVDIHQGRILYSIPFSINEPKQMAAQLMEEHRLPILIENDANACAWAELNNPNYNSLQNFLALLGEIPPAETIGSTLKVDAFSVGMGIAYRRRVYHGTDYFAGEFRSIFWKGEAEGQLSISKSELERFTTSEDIRRQVFSELAMQVALIVNTLNLNGVFICGGMERYSHEFTPLLEQQIKINWSYEMVERNIPLLNSSYGDLSVAVGSAALILDSLFGVPDYNLENGGLSGSIRDRILDHLGSQ
ncbi:MAG: ROK family transcriptional regulator [Spirochaeta sp.]